MSVNFLGEALTLYELFLAAYIGIDTGMKNWNKQFEALNKPETILSTDIPIWLWINYQLCVQNLCF